MFFFCFFLFLHFLGLLQACIKNSPEQARDMLIQNPQLAYALLQAQVVMHLVEPQVAQVIFCSPFYLFLLIFYVSASGPWYHFMHRALSDGGGSWLSFSSLMCYAVLSSCLHCLHSMCYSCTARHAVTKHCLLYASSVSQCSEATCELKRDSGVTAVYFYFYL